MSNSSESLIKAKVKCSCEGDNLDKLLQPQILTILSNEALHGYVIIQKLEDKLLQGEKIDRTGVYRTLKILEDKDLVSSEWDVEGNGAAKKIFKINLSGEKCLANWIDTLDGYQKKIDKILTEARSAIK